MEYIFEGYIRKSEYRKTLLLYFADCGEKIKFSKNELIECTNRALNEVYLITCGKVKQYYMNDEGIERTLLLLAEGDIFGEITLYQGDTDMVITEALEETEVIRITRDEFFTTLKSNDELYNALLEMVTTKFRILMAQIYDSTFLTAKNKLIYLLLRLSRQYGIDKDNDIKINIELTHQEIADMIGSTRSTVTKTLKHFTDNGLIYKQNKCLFLTKKFFDNNW